MKVCPYLLATAYCRLSLLFCPGPGALFCCLYHPIYYHLSQIIKISYLQNQASRDKRHTKTMRLGSARKTLSRGEGVSSFDSFPKGLLRVCAVVILMCFFFVSSRSQLNIRSAADNGAIMAITNHEDKEERIRPFDMPIKGDKFEIFHGWRCFLQSVSI